MQQYERVLEYLEQFDFINIIDVGAARGALIRELVLPQRKSDSYFALGIDPLYFNSARYYQKFLYRAIDNVDKKTFKQFYISSDDQASSLLKMNYDLLTTDLNDKERFYVPWANKLYNRLTIFTLVTSLQNVIDKYFNNKVIHFLKIDVEGNDLNVLKSMNFSNRPLFISAECSSHRDSSKTIFQNGVSKAELLQFMKNANYEIFHEENYEFNLDNKTQMSDIIFKDKI